MGHKLMKSIAGAGKTTALIESIKKEVGKSIFLITFNKSLEEEAKPLEEEFPNLIVSTYHGMAKSNLEGVIGPFEPVDKYLPSHFIDRFEFIQSHKFANVMIQLVTDFCHSKKSLSRFVGWAVRNSEYRKSIGGVSEERVRHLKVVWKTIVEEKFFNHDAYAKLFQLRKPDINFDVIMVDEFQDFSEDMVDVIERAKDKAKIVLAGDYNQRIYEWRGACGWFDLEFEEEIELHRSWRCPQEVLDVANPYTKFLSGVSMTSMKEENGAVSVYTGEDKALDSLPFEDVTFLTRTNAYAFVLAEKMAERGFAVKMDSVVDIEGIDNHWRWLNGMQVNNYLANWTMSKVEDLRAYYWETSQDERIQELNCALEIADLPALRQAFAKEDSEGKPVAHFSTVYRAKGLGFKNVFIASDFTSPFEVPERSDVLTDEDLKLIYVAITRSKSNLWIHRKYVSESDVLEINKGFKYIQRLDKEPILDKRVRQKMAEK